MARAHTLMERREMFIQCTVLSDYKEQWHECVTWFATFTQEDLVHCHSAEHAHKWQCDHRSSGDEVECTRAVDGCDSGLGPVPKCATSHPARVEVRRSGHHHCVPQLLGRRPRNQSPKHVARDNASHTSVKFRQSCHILTICTTDSGIRHRAGTSPRRTLASILNRATKGASAHSSCQKGQLLTLFGKTSRVLGTRRSVPSSSSMNPSILFPRSPHAKGRQTKRQFPGVSQDLSCLIFCLAQFHSW